MAAGQKIRVSVLGGTFASLWTLVSCFRPVCTCKMEGYSLRVPCGQQNRQSPDFWSAFLRGEQRDGASTV